MKAAANISGQAAKWSFFTQLGCVPLLLGMLVLAPHTMAFLLSFCFAVVVAVFTVLSGVAAAALNREASWLLLSIFAIPVGAFAMLFAVPLGIGGGV
jgi:hypothetical protein